MASLTKQLQDLVDLLGEGELSSWEEGFVTSCNDRSVNGTQTARLSGDQVDKLDELWHKYCNTDPYLRHAGDRQPRGF